MNPKQKQPRKFSSEEARIVGKKGGINSGKIRKEKRELKKSLELGLELLTKSAQTKLSKEGKLEEAKLISAIGIGAFQLLQLMMDKKVAPSTRLAALNTIFDRTEGKTIAKIEGEINFNSELSIEEEKLLCRALKLVGTNDDNNNNI